MLNSIKLLEALKESPMQTIVGVLVGSVLWLGAWTITSDSLHAAIQHQQELTDTSLRSMHSESKKYHALVDSMNVMVVRIDENVKHLKER